jgi:uncharacterized protein YjbI with pentapeptide repeats
MANDEHLALLRQGTAIWNEWRTRAPEINPKLFDADLSQAKLSGANLRETLLIRGNLCETDLSDADLRRAQLHQADLRRADLRRADLRGAYLSHANFSGANLSETDLRGARLSGADLSGANLHVARLDFADLDSANLSGADISDTDLSGAKLRGANLVRAELSGALVFQTNLSEANLSEALLHETIFTNTNLNNTLGLSECKHLGPSSIDFRTLSQSRDLPIAFLRGCGLPDSLIDYLPSLSGGAIQFYSCFISYSTKDQVFVERLHADLQNKGVRCWFAPHDLPIGAKTWDAIDEAIRLRDKLLVILSNASIASDWVEDEVNKAYAEERDRKDTVLFPIRIDDAVMATPEPWARKLRDQRHIGDFRQWNEPAEYQKSLERLLRDLKASGAK